MFKRFLLPLFVLFSLATHAQQGTASPYSFFGIGEMRFKGLAENRLMGGVGVFPDSIHVNIQNPASFASLKLTTFTVGANFNFDRYNSYQGTDKAQRATLDYFVVALPATQKIGISFGVLPFTSVGYKNRTTDPQGVIRKYEGEGGLNKAFIGAGYKINSQFSVGADLSYNFGRIETTGIVYVPGLQFGSKETNKSRFSGFNLNFSTIYQTKISKKYNLYASLAYAPEMDLKLRNERVFALIDYVEDYDPGVVENLEAINETRDLRTPGRITFGAGFGQERKWLVGAEITHQQSSGFGNRFGDISSATFENGMRYSFGGYYIPNYASFSNYFNKVTYRAGFRYENTGLIVNGERIRDYAVSGGFGFPLGGTFSNLNMGAELGRKGTAKANLVEENYLNIILSFSLNDQWFIKRRYE